MGARSTPSQGSRRVAVLGASNVALGLPWLVRAARESTTRAGGPELLVAGGHGRSYGLPTRVLGRSLSGLLDCGVWRHLGNPSQRDPPLVVLTDIGNDLMYGVAPERLASWVGTCLERLPADARVTVVGPPLATLAELGPVRFLVLRTLFFPARRMTLRHLREALDRLAHGMRSLADRDPRVALVEPPARWYGLDPIHTRARHREEAWRSILGIRDAAREPAPSSQPVRPAERVRAWTARPESWALFGVACGSRQPSLRLDDGTSLWLY